MVKRIAVLAAAVAALWLTIGSPPADAAEGTRLSFIRDAEVENTIRTFATPLFEAAGVAPRSVDILIVNDQALNAFVAGGLNLFLNTGLLIETDTPEQLLGVIAHETGHIAGGHLLHLGDQMEAARTKTIVAQVLGLAAGLAAGRPDAGIAAAMGTQSAIMRGFLAFNRTQESSADQAALRLLDSAGFSASGLLAFMRKLEGQEMLVTAGQDPYVRTHPLSRERVETIRRHVEQATGPARPLPDGWEERHQRMRAKLFAFLQPAMRTLARYPRGDESVPARYARAVAYFRRGDLAGALPEIDSLIAERPRDPYFHELKGQMLLENHRPDRAVDPYRRAVELAPNEPLIRVALGQALIETGDADLLSQAATHLEAALAAEPRNAFAWRQLAVAQGKRENMGLAAHAMAEHFHLLGQHTEALRQVDRAEQILGPGDRRYLRLQDLKNAARNALDDRS